MAQSTGAGAGGQCASEHSARADAFAGPRGLTRRQRGQTNKQERTRSSCFWPVCGRVPTDGRIAQTLTSQ